MLRFIMSLFAFLPNLGGPDLIVILLIILVLFGAKKLPELAKGWARPSRNSRKRKTNLTTSSILPAKPMRPSCDVRTPADYRSSDREPPAASAETDTRSESDRTLVPNPERTDRV